MNYSHDPLTMNQTQHIKLNDQLILSVEPLGKKVRIILSSSDVELACRKESIKNLQKFLNEDAATIFKGRLQLHKTGEQLTVLLKNEMIGVITASMFNSMLNKA